MLWLALNPDWKSSPYLPGETLTADWLQPSQDFRQEGEVGYRSVVQNLRVQGGCLSRGLITARLKDRGTSWWWWQMDLRYKLLVQNLRWFWSADHGWSDKLSESSVGFSAVSEISVLPDVFVSTEFRRWWILFLIVRIIKEGLQDGGILGWVELWLSVSSRAEDGFMFFSYCGVVGSSCFVEPSYKL